MNFNIRESLLVSLIICCHFGMLTYLSIHQNTYVVCLLLVLFELTVVCFLCVKPND